ncbi:MAG: L,D-transpeptidase family protein, partial [Steroidobacteraceae bacterium]
EELRVEAAARLRAARELPAPDSVPRYLLQLAPSQRHAIVVDASRSRVYVYENAVGAPRLVENYYSSLGKRGIEKEREGDQKTPIGVYHVTSALPGSRLPDLYGWGAFPLSYPNEWDRLQGRSGFGIWIHGVPSDTYARAPQASDGCIALANPEIAQLAKFVQPGLTPVVIAQHADWVAPDAWRAERDAFLRELESWRTDWESRDSVRYLAHYAAGFRSDGMNLDRWRAHKARVNATKSWIKVSLANLSVFRDPGRHALMVVAFDQDYRSSNLAQKSRKRQYWVLEDGRWKIAYEAPVGRPVLALPESYPRPRSQSLAQGKRS